MTKSTGVGRGVGGGPRKLREPEKPADTPSWVSHPSLTAYTHYRCRCGPCLEYRRSYDRERMELVRRTKAYREQEGKKR